MAEFLLQQGYKITFFGQAWSNNSAPWVYFNTKIDIQGLIDRFDLNEDFEIHENLDLKSGTERGLVDKTTNEAIIGFL